MVPALRREDFTFDKILYCIIYFLSHTNFLNSIKICVICVICAKMILSLAENLILSEVEIFLRVKYSQSFKTLCTLAFSNLYLLNLTNDKKYFSITLSSSALITFRF